MSEIPLPNNDLVLLTKGIERELTAMFQIPARYLLGTEPPSVSEEERREVDKFFAALAAVTMRSVERFEAKVRRRMFRKSRGWRRHMRNLKAAGTMPRAKPGVSLAFQWSGPSTQEITLSVVIPHANI